MFVTGCTLEQLFKSNAAAAESTRCRCIGIVQVAAANDAYAAFGAKILPQAASTAQAARTAVGHMLLFTWMLQLLQLFILVVYELLPVAAHMCF